MNEYNQSGQSKSLDAVERGFEILERIIDREEVGVTELAEEIDAPKSTAHSYLTALNRAGYLVNEAGAYRPSFRVVEQAGRHLDAERLVQVSRAKVEKLAHEHGESANLVVREGGKRVIVYQSETEQSVHTSPLGDYAPLHQTAGGKAILSWLSRARIESLIEETGLSGATENTITEREELFDQLEHAHEDGWAYERGEHINGVSSVAAPINVGGTPIGAVSMTGPRDRIYRNRDALAESITGETNVIEVEY